MQNRGNPLEIKNNYFKLLDLLTDDPKAFKAEIDNIHYDVNTTLLGNYVRVAPLLHQAIKSYCPFDIIDFLLKKGANVNLIDKETGQTPLHLAHMILDINIINLLINAGADINCLDIWKQTPLWNLVKLKQKDTILIMLRAGANIQGTNQYESQLAKICDLFADEDLIFIPMGKDSNGVQIYRLADDNYEPYQTIQEKLECKQFCCNPDINALISLSLFKSVADGQLSASLDSNKFSNYLTNMEDIINASSVSAVRNNQGEVVNSEIINVIRNVAKEEAQVILKRNSQHL